MFYLTVSTQWIIAPMGGYVGLNYVAVEAAMNMAPIMKYRRRSLFTDLGLIERTMLPILNKRK